VSSAGTLLPSKASNNLMALVPYRRFCLRFLGGVFLPTACVLAYLIIGLHTSTSLLFGSALALWFWQRGSAHFPNYEDFVGRAMSLAFWSLVGVCFAAPVAGYFVAPSKNRGRVCWSPCCLGSPIRALSDSRYFLFRYSFPAGWCPAKFRRNSRFQIRTNFLSS
jgi:hypothetical protein